MPTPGFKHLLLLLLPPLLAGCPRPDQSLAPPAPPAAPVSTPDLAGEPPADTFDDLAAFLRQARRNDGAVLVDELLRWQAARLDRQLSILKQVGPATTPARFPTPDARLAYWLNARAAWALKLGALAGAPEHITPAALERPFPIDGRTLRLADIDELLRSDPDWHALPAAPGVTLDRADIPARPFSPAALHADLAGRYQAFLADPDRLPIDVQTRQVRLPPVLWSLRPTLLARYRTAYAQPAPTLRAALLDTLTGPALGRLQDAVGFSIVQAPPNTKTCFRKWYQQGR